MASYKVLLDNGYLSHNVEISAQPTYYIEVKTMPMGLETPFYVSKEQFSLVSFIFFFTALLFSPASLPC